MHNESRNRPARTASRPETRSAHARAGFACAGATLLAAVLFAGCASGPESIENPAAVLSVGGQTRERYFDAIEAARLRGVDDDTKAALRRMITANGFAVEPRERAFELLYETDPKAIVAALELNLPTMSDGVWRTRVCELVGDRGMQELVPTLIRAWANPLRGHRADVVRPERVALGRIVGEDQVSATLLRTMKEANPLTQVNLRMRCWELLMKSGDEARLRALLADPASTGGDAMLTDLARVANELGVLPTTNEEILWVRKLCEPSRAAFLGDARLALGQMPAARRQSLELRGVPVAVACMKRRPALLAATEPDIFAEIDARTAGRRKASPDFTGYGSGFTESLRQVREQLSWTDLAAMALALDILADQRMQSHLFEVADRDREDRRTEYGGVIRLRPEAGASADPLGAEFIEFEPRTKTSDIRYENPQALFDALYTGLFHVHFHAAKYDNETYAGPHMGDFAFADSSRCNGIVFTFLTADLLGVDFYRHGKVVVDLGAIGRPQG